MQNADFYVIDKGAYKIYTHDQIAIIYYNLDPDPESLTFLDVSNASRINPKENETLLDRLIKKSDSFLLENEKLASIMDMLRKDEISKDQLNAVVRRSGSEKARHALYNIINVLGHNNILEQSHALVALIAPISAIMEIQDERFIASQERSTRYVKFNELYVPASLQGNNEAYTIYTSTANLLKEAYEKAFNEMIERLSALYDQKERIPPNKDHIQNIIEPTARDLVRGLLPMGMQTVAFFSTNAKNLENITKKLLAKKDSTCNILGSGLKQAIEQNMPSFSKHLEPDLFEKDYFNSIKKINYTYEIPVVKSFDEENVSLDYATDENTLLGEIASMTGIEKSNALEYIKNIAQNRHGKYNSLNSTVIGVGSMLFSFDISIGSLRDLQRHRDAIKNYEINDNICYLPAEIIGSNSYTYIRYVLGEVANSRKKLAEMGFVDEAKLLMPLATGARMSMHTGFGEAIYIIENRTTKEAHPEYRGIALKMFDELKKSYPSITKAINIFANASDQVYSRAEKQGTNDVNKELLF